MIDVSNIQWVDCAEACIIVLYENAGYSQHIWQITLVNDSLLNNEFKTLQHDETDKFSAGQDLQIIWNVNTVT